MTTPDPSKSVAWNEGHLAHAEGQPRTANPHPVDVIFNAEWAEGWDSADADEIPY